LVRAVVVNRIARKKIAFRTDMMRRRELGTSLARHQHDFDEHGALFKVSA